MTHQSGVLCSESGAGIIIRVLVMLITCVLACLLPPKKIFCSPSVSRSVCQRKPTICLCVFLRDISYSYFNSDCSWSFTRIKRKKRIGINYPSLHPFEEHGSRFKAALSLCFLPSREFEAPENLWWSITFKPVGCLWNYCTAKEFLFQIKLKCFPLHSFFSLPSSHWSSALQWRCGCLSSLHKPGLSLPRAAEPIAQVHIFLDDKREQK